MSIVLTYGEIKVAEVDTYTGVNVRSSMIVLSREFCDIYVKNNKFATPEWDAKEKVLKLTFYPSGSDISFRLPLIQYPGGSPRIHITRFFSQHSASIKRGRYEIFDAALNKSGTSLTLKLKFKEIESGQDS